MNWSPGILHFIYIKSFEQKIISNPNLSSSLSWLGLYYTESPPKTLKKNSYTRAKALLAQPTKPKTSEANLY